MPRFIVRCDDKVLNDCVVGAIATIGRRADNAIVVEDTAVSGHHACVVRDGDHHVVKDLESTNGTFVNDRRVTTKRLQEGDVIGVGRHRLVFHEIQGETATATDAAPLMSNPGETVFLDANKHQALLAMLQQSDTRVVAAAPLPNGVLRVLTGAGAPTEYRLEAETSLIGRSDTALVRLRGWFKPKVAVAIARNGDSYVATLMGGKTLINSQPLDGRRRLQDGDVLDVGGVRVEFRLSA